MAKIAAPVLTYQQQRLQNSTRFDLPASFAIESQAFTDGYYFAFSLSDCGLCKECAGYCGEGCRFPKKARPAFHSVGIDVFATVRKFGLPIETLSSLNDQENWYSAVFIE